MHRFTDLSWKRNETLLKTHPQPQPESVCEVKYLQRQTHGWSYTMKMCKTSAKKIWDDLNHKTRLVIIMLLTMKSNYPSLLS